MNKTYAFLTIGVTVLVVLGMYLLRNVDVSKEPYVASDLETFATCIANSGAKFYGASWCGHCQNQKRMFGSAMHLLPYVECATKEGGQAQECADAKITAYPTWVFSNGEQMSGEMPFVTLGEKTGCTTPSERQS